MGRVLIVDDEPPLLKMMSIYLQRKGHSVTTCSSTDDAAAKVEASPAEFDVAVLDATMDGLSMEELALRLLKANAALRVLAASGYPVDTSALEAAAPGRVAFLLKPFSPEMLASEVGRMLGEKEKDL